MSSVSSSPASRWRRLGVLVALLALTIWGASQLQFLCDDAYINFRHVSIAYDGGGLAFNAPPFRPVEGYTSFLWVVALWACWSWFGVEPPQACQVVSLLCGVALLVIVARTALRLRDRRGTALPDVVALAVLLAVVGNRTFLSWLSSGMDTAMFELFLVAWVLLPFCARDRSRDGWLVGWAVLAVLTTLTRPDGLLCVMATAAIAGHRAVSRRSPRALLAVAPLVLVAVHMLWRRAYYGAWLPNTYYAKVGGFWPEAGLRYFACFCVEHGVWLWAPLCLSWLLVEVARLRGRVWGAIRDQLPAAAAVAVVVAHWGYYTFRVGGDHFEYRVYSHLVPLGALSAAAMAARLRVGAVLPVLAAAGLLVASGVGWLHLHWTRSLPWHGFVPIAARMPDALQPLGRWFDRQQAWLRMRMIGLRCNHHALFLAQTREVFPQRLRHARDEDDVPVLLTGRAGLASWNLPDCAVLDLHGLNDWVIARTPRIPQAEPLQPDRLREMFALADVDHSGHLVRAEIEGALRLIAPGGSPSPAAVGSAREFDGAEYLAALLLAIYARERPDGLVVEEVAGIGLSLAGSRSMAHERLPPAGYVEEFAPNVAVVDGRIVATPRPQPLDAARIRDIEERWWAWAAAQAR